VLLPHVGVEAALPVEQESTGPARSTGRRVTTSLPRAEVAAPIGEVGATSVEVRREASDTDGGKASKAH
jgi:hypothetical protein